MGDKNPNKQKKKKKEVEKTIAAAPSVSADVGAAKKPKKK